MKKPLLILIISCIVLAGGFVLFSQRPHAVEKKSAESPITVLSNSKLQIAKGAPQQAYIQVGVAETFPLPVVEPLNARITYNDNHTARITSPIAARVLKIQAELGDDVVAGKSLALLDAPDYAQAIADVRKAEADQQFKQKQYQRAETLWRGDAIAKREVENTEADLQSSQAETARAKQRLQNLTHGGVDSSGALALRAPISGTIVERQINPGTEVAPDSPNPLFVISDLKSVWVYVDLPERYLGKVSNGMNAVLTSDAYAGERFGGVVDKVSTILDPTTRRFTVRCSFPNSDYRLRPEMFGQVTFSAKNSPEVWRVLNTALIIQGIQQYLFVETQPGEYEKVQIEVLSKDHRFSYVSGKLEGKKIVTKGALLLNAELVSGN